MDPAVSPELLDSGGAPAFLSERALAMLEFIREQDPGLLDLASRSERDLRDRFILNFWSSGTADSLSELWPVFLIHTAESARRGRDFKKALAMSDRAIALAPERAYFRIVKALALTGLGRGNEAAAEFRRVSAYPGLRSRVSAFSAAYGATF